MKKKSQIFLKAVIICLIPLLGAANNDGAQIFKANCASCHKLGMRLVGPDLTGMSGRHTHEWLKRFITSSQTLIKSGDPWAVQIFEEFNQTLMPDQNLSSQELNALISYIDGTPNKKEKVVEIAQLPFEYNNVEVAKGMNLFSGVTRMVNGGPTCISCHNINHAALIPGGLLAKDLTKASTRLTDYGVLAIIQSSPFPAMAQSYEAHELTEEEVRQLTAFLSDVNRKSDQEVASNDYTFMLFRGLGGFAILLILISLIWNRRKQGHTKGEVFKRQMHSKGTKI